MKSRFYNPLLVPALLVTMCAPVLCAPAKSVRSDATAKVLQRKQVLHYYISASLLTHRIQYVQWSENALLQHPGMWYDSKHPKEDVWGQKMRAQIVYMHTLKQAAKSLNVPEVCRFANRELVTCLDYLEVAYTKLYQGQTVRDQSRDDAHQRMAVSLMDGGEKAANKSFDLQTKYLESMETLANRFDLRNTGYGPTDWLSAAMG